MAHPSFTFFTSPLPKPAFAEEGERFLLQLLQAASGEAYLPFRQWLATTEGQTCIIAIAGNSPYLRQLLLKQWEWFDRLLAQGAEATFETLLDSLSSLDATSLKKDALMTVLRQAKQRAALLIAIADITGLWTLEQVTHALTVFAEAALSLCCRFLLLQAASNGEIALKNHAYPEQDSGFIIWGLGKLGGYELNYSSDIDLIVFYDLEKVDYRGAHTVQHLFVQITRELVTLMQERTKDGYVFRVDLRLRPDPASTPLALSIQAAENYYETVGQNWERAALIKARPVAGDITAGEAFLYQLRPFVWRKYLDFAALEDIRSIKRQIESKQLHVANNLAGYNIKIGHGGIREIEFFAQTQQLIWGGRYAYVRERATCMAMQALVTAGQVKQEVAEEHASIYRYFRILEHRLQMVDDQQTHSLPITEPGLTHIAIFMGYAHPDAFIKELTHYLERVRYHYSCLFQTSPSLSTEGKNLVFTGTNNDPETVGNIQAMGFKDADAISERIRGWHHGRHRSTRTKRARELITELTPAILRSFGTTTAPDIAFLRFDTFLSRLPAGLQLFALFQENHHLLDLVADIMGNYPYLAEQLSRKPALLDYVLTAGFLNPISHIETLREELMHFVKDARDYEDMLDITRRWTHERQFQVGVQLIRGIISLAHARSSLSDIAETVLAVLATEVEHAFSQKHGTFSHAAFGVIALGKLGSRELSFNSDIDLILVYDADGEDDALSDGEEPLNISMYYNRLARRFLASFTALTTEGKLYNIDIRLRPSGNDSPMCTRIKTLDHYFGTTAHVWEYMALTRARVIAAPAQFAEQVTALLKTKLAAYWDQMYLAENVRAIRDKIEQTYGTDNPWKIKYARGGLIDCDFIAQYLELLYAHQHPSLLHPNTATVYRKAAEFGLLSEKAAQELEASVHFLADVQSLLRLSYEGTLTESVKKILVSVLKAECFEEIEERLLVTESHVVQYFDEVIQ